jgi:hypothetical protein
VLSDESIDRLVSAPMVNYGKGEERRRADAREAVMVAADELEFDPMKPPLPRFAAGEDTLAAAVRALGLSHAAKALEQYRRRRAACEELARRFEALRRRRDELRIVELNRLRQELERGRVPEPASEELRAELGAIHTELSTIGDFDVGLLVQYRPDRAVLEEAIKEREWLTVTFLVHLISERLLALTEDEPYNAKARMFALTANSVAVSYERRVNTAPQRFAPEHERAVRSIRWCVQTADLHRLPERRERTFEELAGEPVDVPA